MAVDYLHDLEVLVDGEGGRSTIGGEGVPTPEWTSREQFLTVRPQVY